MLGPKGTWHRASELAPKDSAYTKGIIRQLVALASTSFMLSDGHKAATEKRIQELGPFPEAVRLLPAIMFLLQIYEREI